MTAAWRNKNFRWLWAGATASTFGAEIAEIALPLLALITLSATASELSALRVAQFLPYLIATLPLGLLVDRHVRQRLKFMIGADIGRFLLIASIPSAIFLGAGSIELLMVTVFFAGVLTVLYDMSNFAFLPSIISEEQLVDANGKLEATDSASEIGGRGIGGLAVQVFTAPVTVGANALGYLVSAVCLTRVRSVSTETPGPLATESSTGLTAGSGTARHEVWQGLRIALKNRYIRPLVGEATTFNFSNEIFLLGLMLWAVRDLGYSAGTIGLILTAGGVGSFIGAWFGGRLTQRFGYGRVLLITLIFGNGAPLALFASSYFGNALVVLFCTVFVLMGVGTGIANMHAVSLRQSAVSEELNGRANAAYRLLSWGAIPLGAGVGGIIASTFDGKTATLVGSVGLAAATLWVAASDVPRLTSISDAGTSDSALATDE